MLHSQTAPTTRIDDALSIRDGRLFIEGCDAAELAETVWDASLRHLRGSTSAKPRAPAASLRELWPGELRVLPSIKANASLAVRRILTKADTGCDASARPSWKRRFGVECAPSGSR